MSRAGVALIGTLALVAGACTGMISGGPPPGSVDGLPDGGSPGADGAPPPGVQSAGCVAGRSEVDRPDDTPLHQIRVLYVVPSDGEDRALDTSGRICNSAIAFSTWFRRESGDSTLRFDTFGGEIDIGFVRLEQADAEVQGSTDAEDLDAGVAYIRDRIERELVARGIVVPTKLYAVYYDGSTTWKCGSAPRPPELVGRVAAVYPRGQQDFVSCEDYYRPWGQANRVPKYLDYAMLHEIFHALGAVSPSAPNAQPGSHVFEIADGAERDLMYHPREGEDDPGWDPVDHRGLVLDVGSDDYFRHGDAFLDVAASVFLDPVPGGAAPPPGW